MPTQADAPPYPSLFYNSRTQLDAANFLTVLKNTKETRDKFLRENTERRKKLTRLKALPSPTEKERREIARLERKIPHREALANSLSEAMRQPRALTATLLAHRRIQQPYIPSNANEGNNAAAPAA